MDTPFSIIIEFATPAIFGRRSNLDALLANLLYQQARFDGMDEVSAINHAHSNVPLLTVRGIAAGSSAIIPQCDTEQCVLVQSLYRHLQDSTEPEEWLRPNVAKRKNSNKFDGIAEPILKSFQSHNVNQAGMFVMYLGKGDRQQVEYLVNPLEGDHLGKKRSIGYGKIKKITFYDMPDHPHFGLLSANGTMLRPVPQELMDRIKKPKHYGLAFESFRPPYWKTEPALCYVPPSKEWDGEVISDLRDRG